MSRHSMNMELLQKLNSVAEEYSENDQDISDIEELESDKGVIVISSESEKDDDMYMIECTTEGTVWHKINSGNKQGRSRIHNVFKERSGPTGHAKRYIMKGDARTAFSVIIDHKIIEHIKRCTEAEACRVTGTEWCISTAKLNAFIALLYARGAYDAKNLDISYLWNKKWGPPFFSNTMDRNSFAEIMRFIRFDLKNQRSQRLQNDKFALISEIWYPFIENSQNCYKPGPYLTVDEQLFSTKARCRFTQYMPNKPDKFGIKFWLAVDVSSKYIVNGFTHLGKDETRDQSVPLGESVTLKLVEPYISVGRNITTDNFFTSVSLAKKLLAKKTTLVGTIRRNRRDIPILAKQIKDNMPVLSTKLYQSNNCTLTIYKAKARKKVLILSSMHATV